MMSIADVGRKLKFQYKVTFISAIIFGIVSQGMGLFNKYSVHDDVTMLFDVGATYTSGRWMLDVLSNLETRFFGDGHYSLPTINGLLSIVCIAVAACLIVDLLDIRNDYLCALLGGLMTCFPVITSLFGYMFTLHFYMIAMLASVFGAYLVCKHDRWYLVIAGILLMGAAVGVYQAFIPITLSVMLLYCINYVAGEKKIFYTEVFTRIILLCASAILFIAFYFGMNKWFLAQKDAQLSVYKGIDTMGKISFSEYMSRAIIAYREFFVPSRGGDSMYPHSVRNIYYIVLTGILVLSVILIVRLIRKNLFQGIICATMLIVLPICTNFIFVMAGKEEVTSLMVYAQLVPFCFFIWLVDKVQINYLRINKGINILACCVLLTLNIMYCRYDNKCYMRAAFAQQESISYFTTLVTQIKCSDGYRDELPVVFVNSGKNTDKSLRELSALTDIRIAPYGGVNDYVNDYAWSTYMGIWCGYYPSIIEEDQFEGMSEVMEMPSYPDQGSIRVINDTIIVKF